MTTRRTTVAGLVAVILGLVVQIAGGNQALPVIPPGLVLGLLAIAAAMAERPWWLPCLAWAVPAVLLVGGLVSDPGLVTLLTDPDNEVIRAGALLVALGESVALLGGLALARTTWRGSPSGRRVQETERIQQTEPVQESR